jgi:hypothetical protein
MKKLLPASLTLLIVGILLLGASVLFKIMHWPGAAMGLMIGTSATIIGLLFLALTALLRLKN